MKIAQIRLVGIRCFEDTGDLSLAQKFNLIVGQNNAGKSTLLRAILHLQGMFLDAKDIRPQTPNSWISILLGDATPTDNFAAGSYAQPNMRYSVAFSGNAQNYDDYPVNNVGAGQPIFHSSRPYHHLVPFIAKRKASGFNEVINAGALTGDGYTPESLFECGFASH